MKIPLALALLASGAAHADYICKELPKIPGSTYVQVFEINNANQLVGGSDSGAVLYSACRWSTLPAPPASSGYQQSSLGALGINDAGDVAGEASDAAGHQQIMLYSGGSYSFTAPFAPWPSAQARAINSSGIMTGTAFDDDGNGVGFVYNPMSKPPYAPGFTLVAPPLADGTEPFNVIAAQMNDAGQFVGGGFYPVRRGNRAFSFDPATGQYTLFQINGWNTRARGLNNKGDVLAEAIDPATGSWHNYIADAQGAVRSEVTCPNVPQGSNGLFMVGINDRGVISGGQGDASGNGVMAFPDAASALADLVDCSGATGPGKSLPAKARAAAGSYAAGDVAGACSALAGFAAEVKAQSGKHVDDLLAPSLLSEVAAIEAALGCN